ncbi:MAG: thiamine pyrophosphate-dependent enzyme [Bacteroidota bacterium]|nr:thiamine pyrophosphate-dependent enzyme [Bacteroidota bacterium]MDP4231755.1 thiamine pyrophosphate-dependent enzyme [Bacteroidota bacterium]MDP4243491.1 thiamine pyrophosphate-dependent enzyme [Bacteroidota bacterium]MDP4287092.1 thiamine pyrophosphate-dependent enzyme [Bacteroidota bacterium]
MKLSHAISRALLDSGVRIATHVPGHGATETFEAFRDALGQPLPVSFHEEPAYAIAHGAALTGARAACIIKSHGFTKAMNAITDSLSCGTTAALITIVFEDKTGSHSDNIIEILPIIEGCEIPYRLGRPETAYRDVVELLILSEKYQLPVVLVLDAADMDRDVEAAGPTLQSPPAYERTPLTHVVCPLLAPYQRELLVQKLRKEDWREIPQPQLPIVPASLPPAYQKAVAPYMPLFDVFKELEVDFVCGDAGVSTLSAFPPFNIAHAALYMGGSIPTAIGAYLAGMKHSWSFIGDFSFIAAGHYSLVEAVLRQIPIKVLIYANAKAETTGGQTLDLALLERLLAGYEEYVIPLDNPFDAVKTRQILEQANSSPDLSIVVANYC